jgi:hypothetical protein
MKARKQLMGSQVSSWRQRYFLEELWLRAVTHPESWISWGKMKSLLVKQWEKIKNKFNFYTAVFR